jgi:hypothetical protein
MAVVSLQKQPAEPREIVCGAVLAHPCRSLRWFPQTARLGLPSRCSAKLGEAAT